jgi:copper transport protein
LLFVLPRATRELESADRGRLLAANLSRFSSVALISVGAILVTGLIQAYIYVRRLDALLETGYGRAVLIGSRVRRLQRPPGAVRLRPRPGLPL